MGGGGNNRYTPTRIGLLAIVCAYIIYLGGSILLSLYRGEGGIHPALAILFGVLFIVVGVAYLIYLFKQYQALKEQETEEVVTSTAEEMEASDAEEIAASDAADAEEADSSNIEEADPAYKETSDEDVSGAASKTEEENPKLLS